ncbi:hypothetical protein HMPREF0731_1021, partial [Pseudoroseomonas cervicalis ATCC 49957]
MTLIPSRPWPAAGKSTPGGAAEIDGVGAGGGAAQGTGRAADQGAGPGIAGERAD